MVGSNVQDAAERNSRDWANIEYPTPLVQTQDHAVPPEPGPHSLERILGLPQPQASTPAPGHSGCKANWRAAATAFDLCDPSEHQSAAPPFRTLSRKFARQKDSGSRASRVRRFRRRIRNKPRPPAMPRQKPRWRVVVNRRSEQMLRWDCLDWQRLSTVYGP